VCRLGRIAAGDEFLSSPFYWLLLQTGIDGNPEGIFFNTKGMTAYPVATWGIRVRAKPTDDVYVMAAVFNGDPTLADIDKHGVDWSLAGRPFAMFEAGYHLNQRRGATGLPGDYKVGAYDDGSTFTEFMGAPTVTGLPTRTIQGNAGFYVLADQMVFREGGAGSPRGLTPFVSLLVSPNADINTFPFFVNGGLVYQGPLRSRARDAAGFGVVYGKFSRVLQQAQRAQQVQDPSVGVQKYEIALEWFYLIQATRWLTIQPDIQYVIKPGGTGQIPNALVLGFQMAVSF
jgi:porin